MLDKIFCLFSPFESVSPPHTSLSVHRYLKKNHVQHRYLEMNCELYLFFFCFACLVEEALGTDINLVKVMQCFEKASGFYLANVIKKVSPSRLKCSKYLDGPLCLMIHFTSGPLALTVCIVYISLPASLLPSLTFFVLPLTSLLIVYKFIELLITASVYSSTFRFISYCLIYKPNSPKGPCGIPLSLCSCNAQVNDQVFFLFQDNNSHTLAFIRITWRHC